MIFLRSLLFNVVFFCLSLGLALWGTVFCRQPIAAMALGKLWARLCLRAAHGICGITLEVSGGEHLPAGAALIASAHQSAFDTILWFSLLPAPAYVMKLELARLPLFGGVAMRSGMIAVDRSGGAAALRALVQRCAAAAASGRQIVIFPQGTRAAVGEEAKLHPGVAAVAGRTGLPVIPVWTDSGRLWGRRRFTKLPGVVHLSVLPPLSAALPRKALMAALEVIGAVDKPVQSGAAEFPDHESEFP